jgi:hypothetical protein
MPSSCHQVYAQTDYHSNNQFLMIDAVVAQNLQGRPVALQQWNAQLRVASDHY